MTNKELNRVMVAAGNALATSTFDLDNRNPLRDKHARYTLNLLCEDLCKQYHKPVDVELIAYNYGRTAYEQTTRRLTEPFRSGIDLKLT